MKPKVSLVLSGGGARGIAHIGVIEELERQGFEIFSIAGTSMGALVGGVYALGKMQEYKEWLYTLDKRKIFGLIDFTLYKGGLIKGEKVFNKMKEFISDANIEDLPIHYAAVAADIRNKKEVVFTSGSIYSAIRASVSIPTLFTPVKTENGLLVDGGIVNSLPISHAKRMPNDLLIAVDVNADIPLVKDQESKKEDNAKQAVYRKKINDFYRLMQKKNPLDYDENVGYFDLINKTINMMTYHITQMSLEKHAPDILINISRESCNMYDFYKAEELVKIGQHAAFEHLKGLNGSLKKEI